MRRRSPGKHKGLDYARTHNLTRYAYERCVADLEGGTSGFAFSSGMAATATILELLAASRTWWRWTTCTAARGASSSACAGARGPDFTYTTLASAQRGARKGARPRTKMIWVESPSNPLLKLVDLEMVAEVAKKKGILAVPTTRSHRPGCSARSSSASTSWSTRPRST
jgi:cystathionine beta-lyase/cystathionine gamma-synthase